jgi:hypothetical protein
MAPRNVRTAILFPDEKVRFDTALSVSNFVPMGRSEPHNPPQTSGRRQVVCRRTGLRRQHHLERNQSKEENKIESEATEATNPNKVARPSIIVSDPHKQINPIHRAGPPPTKSELYHQLVIAWRNTAQLA